MTEHFTPSISVEPPREPTLQSYEMEMFNELCAPPDSSECYPQPPALFIQPSISTTELENFLQAADGKFGFSPATSGSGSSSPVGLWSPASSFSGEVFPDEFTQDDFSAWSQSLSGHPSPAPSSSSLSPLTSAFDGFALEEGYQSTEHSVLNGPPAFSRLRSSSHSAPSTTEMWVDSGVGRGRSSSFSGPSDTQFFTNPAPAPLVNVEPPSGLQMSVSDLDLGLADALGTSGMSWGAVTDADVASVTPDSPLGALVPGWRYPGRDGPAADTRDLSQSPVSPSDGLLTVPNIGLSGGLHRRSAISPRPSRRALSHSDINSLMPPEFEQGRGRGQHRTTLSIPNSRSVSNTSSRDVSPHSDLGYYSPAPSSPAFEDAEAEADLDEPISIGRRSTFTALRGPRDGMPSAMVPLSRAISAPSVRSRRSRGVSVSHNAAEMGLGVYKAEAADYLYPETHGAAAEFLLSQLEQQQAQQQAQLAVPGPAPFKSEVASNKIRQASNARRLNAAAFQCPLPTCGSTFTARHNLINHINSHNKHRPHKCLCGMSFTTQGVLNRHKKRCKN
ncbi:C2H2-type domain-containing protein [Mycena chlorophos]|uniref:C2H2-type domain-containing protein n=1 Tax=Mycena chlorophos TaxID=658473 RepID=A0A8H6VQ43_MYCCL|nr:C2H2-type domain-containing protein [Mycena chlorophos]